MASEEIGVQHGTLAHLGGDMEIGLVHVREGQGGDPPEVVLFIKDESERDLTLRPGDTFPIGDQTWVLDRVDFGGTRPGAVFSRVE
ncbi:hypothetical protein LUW76_36505 [Actinomadura madurae]|uniref:DUF6406 domain-containing protein n=1 Tax=Actinomadura madurae TaxID=1993 RepID=UPI0020266860|nr:DUF6406 domain-containing protein [Actinomadura madurae]URM99382.1 hypothetical protein LUW76_36505 [Actinomadura madurae]